MGNPNLRHFLFPMCFRNVHSLSHSSLPFNLSTLQILKSSFKSLECVYYFLPHRQNVFSIFFLDQYLLITQVSHSYGFLRTIFWSEYLVNLLLVHSQAPLHDTNHNFVIIKLVSVYLTFYISYTARSTLLDTPVRAQWRSDR